MTLSGATTSPRAESKRLRPASEAEVMRVWWLRAVTLTSGFYIVASETLSDLPGWSRLGIISATALLFLLGLGRLLGFNPNRIGTLPWLPCVFLSFCLLKGVVGASFTNAPDVLSAVVSAYLGGMAVGLALQAGLDFRVLVYAQMMASLCQIAAGFYGFGNDTRPGETEVRYEGLTGNANELGLQLTLGACMIWLMPKRAGLLGCCFAFIATGYAVATTGSRQALFAAGFFLVLVAIQSWTLIKRRRVAVLLSLAALGLVALLVAPLVIDRSRDITAVQRTLEYENDSSYHKRVTMMRQGLHFWQQAPLLGNGLAAFQDLSGQGTYAHNDYVELLCDLGLFGVLLFYGMHANILIRAARLPNPLKLYCWLFILLLLALDMGSVGYKRKQTIMLLMVVTSLVTRPRLGGQVVALRPRRFWGRPSRKESASI